jgi:hypothetical protein
LILGHEDMTSVSLTVRSIAGEVVWGPESISSAEKCSELYSLVAKKLGQSKFSLQLVHGESLLNAETVLDEYQVSFGDVFTVTVSPIKQRVYTIMQQLISQSCTVELRLSTKVIVENCLEENPNMPEEVRAWLQVFIDTSMVPCDFDHDFQLDDVVFQDGLLYISQFGKNDNVICVFVDCAAKLRGFQDQADGDSCTVWYADVWDNVWDIESDVETWSPDFWAQIRKDLGDQASGGNSSLCYVDQAPTVVAESLSDFFEQWCKKGHVPTARFRYRSLI